MRKRCKILVFEASRSRKRTRKRGKLHKGMDMAEDGDGHCFTTGRDNL